MARKRKSKIIFQGDGRELCTLIGRDVWTVFIQDQVLSPRGEHVGFMGYTQNHTLYVRADNCFGQLAKAVKMIREYGGEHSTARGVA
jgi:hypothetical protein